jgi:hypothetical protein
MVCTVWPTGKHLMPTRRAPNSHRRLFSHLLSLPVGAPTRSRRTTQRPRSVLAPSQFSPLQPPDLQRLPLQGSTLVADHARMTLDLTSSTEFITLMGQLGDCCDHFAMVLDMGSRTWCIARDNSWSYRRLVLCRVSPILLCYGLIPLIMIDVPRMAVLRFLRHLRWTRTAYMLRSIAHYSHRSAA